MRMVITQRYRPHTHQKGALLWLPSLPLAVRVWPARLAFMAWEADEMREVASLSLAPAIPLDGFTAQVDLEQGSLLVWGGNQKGYLRCSVRCRPEGLLFSLERFTLGERLHLSSEGALLASTDGTALGTKLSLQKGETTLLSLAEASSAPLRSLVPSAERLFLGCSKGQLWSSIASRCAPTELMALFHRAAQWLPPIDPLLASGQATLLGQYRESLEQKQVEKAALLLRQLLQGMVTPEALLWLQPDHWSLLGYSNRLVGDGCGPVTSLQGLVSLFRKSLIQEEAGRVTLLPLLPASWPAGHFLDLSLQEGALQLSFIWSKKRLRCAKLQALKAVSISLEVEGSASQSCRLRRSLREKGERHSFPLALELESDSICYLDRIER